MAAFSYAALDGGGKERRGVIEADSSRQARQQLRDQGLAPLRVEPAHAAQPAAGSSGVRRRRGPTLRAAELALLTRQMATLLQSGLPLEEALLAMSRQSESARLRHVVSAVRSRVLEGHTLAGSLAEFPGAFPGLYRATVAAGEHAGHLDAVLQRLADYTESAHAARQRVQLALLYPVLLVIVALVIVAGLMAFVVPQVVGVFEGQGQTLPLLTRVLIALSDFVVNWGLWTLLGLLLLGWGMRRWLQREGPALRWHRSLLHLPLIRRLSRGSNSARYAGTLSILSSAGVPLVEGMRIAAQVLSNHWLRRQAEDAAQAVSEGSSLNQALARCGYFPPMMIHMIASGEISGDLDRMLERVAEQQQREFDGLVSTGIGLFEPLMLLLMGAVVLIIVLAILLPVFSLNQMI